MELRINVIGMIKVEVTSDTGTVVNLLNKWRDVQKLIETQW